MRLLLVEDDTGLAATMKRHFSDGGFAVDVASTAETAMAALEVAAWDLVVLDMSLPDAHGSTVLRWLRRHNRTTPVLVATATSEPDARVRTLDDGADDYMVKPFAMDEMQARVRALLRRPHQALPACLRVGNVELDMTAFTVRIRDVPVDVSRRELTVLAALMRAPGRLLTRRHIEESIYPLDHDVTPNAVEAGVSRLRRRLAAHDATIVINTVRGLGYRLTERA